MSDGKSSRGIPRTTTSKLYYLIFGFVILYFIVVLYSSLTARTISGYEVKEGSLAVNNTYRGLCLRSEKVFEVKDNGYINYYAREGERVPYGAIVFTVDEGGRLSELLKRGYTDGQMLSNEDMSELKTQIINYTNSYSDYNFGSVYDFKFAVKGRVFKLANKNVLDSLSKINDRSVLANVKYSYASESGIVVYSRDGYEELTTSDINEETFDEEEYALRKEQLSSGNLVEPGDPGYKLVTQENWSVVIPIEASRVEELTKEGFVKVCFLKNGDISWGKVNCFQDEAGKDYCKLDFTNSMITFATDRFLDIELVLETKKGLKIPNSAIVEKEFYLIPKSFLIGSTEDGDTGFMREAYMEDGTVATEFVPAQIYQEVGDEVYVDTSVFRLGDYILAEDKMTKFSIGKKDTLIGVYNMNKGYADFRQIRILYYNREYSVVEPNSQYGLSVYDHIVLDGTSVTDDEYIL